MARSYVELERDARRGKLSYRTVTLYLNKGWITADEARELNRLIAEYERSQQVLGGAVVVPTVAQERRFAELQDDLFEGRLVTDAAINAEIRAQNITPDQGQILKDSLDWRRQAVGWMQERRVESRQINLLSGSGAFVPSSGVSKGERSQTVGWLMKDFFQFAKEIRRVPSMEEALRKLGEWTYNEVRRFFQWCTHNTNSQIALGDFRDLGQKFDGSRIGGPSDGPEYASVQWTHRRREDFCKSLAATLEEILKSGSERSTTEVEEEKLEELYVSLKLREWSPGYIRRKALNLEADGIFELPADDYLARDGLYDIGTVAEPGLAQKMVEWVLDPLDLLVKDQVGNIVRAKNVEFVDSLPERTTGDVRRWLRAPRKRSVPAAIQRQVEDGTVWAIHPELYARHLTLAYLALAGYMASGTRTLRGIGEFFMTELPIIGPVGAAATAVFGFFYGLTLGSALASPFRWVLHTLFSWKNPWFDPLDLGISLGLLLGMPILGAWWFRRLTLQGIRSTAPTWPLFIGLPILGLLGLGVVGAFSNILLGSLKEGSLPGILVGVWGIALTPLVIWAATRWLAARYSTRMPR